MGALNAMNVASAIAHRLSAIPIRLLPFRGGCHDETPLVSPALHDAFDRGALSIVDAVAALESSGVRTQSGRQVRADRIVWATGYRRDTAWLDRLIALDAKGRPRERGGIVQGMDGLAFVGLPCMRTRRSGFLRGFVDDALAVVRALR